MPFLTLIRSILILRLNSESFSELCRLSISENGVRTANLPGFQCRSSSIMSTTPNTAFRTPDGDIARTNDAEEDVSMPHESAGGQSEVLPLEEESTTLALNHASESQVPNNRESQRPRGRPRGSRGRRRGSSGRGGRGIGPRSRRAARNNFDASSGWVFSDVQCSKVTMESAFTEQIVMQRARLLCLEAMAKAKVQLNVNNLPSTRCGFVVLLMQGLLRQITHWLNENIRLNYPSKEAVTFSDMLRYVAVLLLSHTTGLSFEKTIDVLRQSGCIPPPLEAIRFISANVMAYSATGRGGSGEKTWNAQRDQTRFLGEFECLAFRDTRKICFTPLYQMATLDDDLFGTRAADNQVKMLSNRKADREGHSADAVADALFRIVLALRFRRRAEPQHVSVRKLIDSLMDGRGEKSITGCIVTADRGYGNERFMKILMEQGLGSIFVMPDHILGCHPFVGKSFLNPLRGDLEADANHDTNIVSDPTQSGDAGTETPMTGRQEDGQRSQDVNDDSFQSLARVSDGMSGMRVDGRELIRTPNERRKKFIIDDHPDLGPEVFVATKSVPGVTQQMGHNKLVAIAVRERGTSKFSRILRFMHSIPQSIQESINTWIAVPKANLSLNNTLFSGKVVGGNHLVRVREVIESKLKSYTVPLTLGQRCADWFVLRQFRVTGTMAGSILLNNEEVNVYLGTTNGESSIQRNTAEEWFEKFQSSWFSSKVSTESMMRGTVNEPAVMSALAALDFVDSIFDVGMMAIRDAKYLACSPDAVAFLTLSKLASVVVEPENVLVVGAERFIIAVVEIKTKVASTTLGEVMILATPDLVYCELGDDDFRKYVPKAHMGQVLHQAVVLKLQFILYVNAAETGLLYCVLIRCPMYVIERCEHVMRDLVGPLVAWAYERSPTIPQFVAPEQQAQLKARHKFWYVIEQHVSLQGAFPPLKLFKHASQSIYSKTKCGVDGATQQRAVLRSSTSSFKWEQKVVSQVLKTVAINGFFLWRIFQRRDLLESARSFKSLEKYRYQLNKVQGTADFMFDVSQELLSYAATLQIEKQDDFTLEEVSDPSEIRRLCDLAKHRKRNRLTFFNNEDGTKLRLGVNGHDLKQAKVSWCALCGLNKESYRGRRSTYTCSRCHVHLCVRTYAGLRKSCWGVWHTAKVLKARRTPTPVSPRSASPDRQTPVENIEGVRGTPNMVSVVARARGSVRNRPSSSRTTSQPPLQRRRLNAD